MSFTLILATLHRVDEVSRFLKSLRDQRDVVFELIVVDQNDDDRLNPILEDYRKEFPLRHLRCQPGLSRARNEGLRFVNCDLVAFPDDDCWYPAGLLHSVEQQLHAHPEWDGLSGIALDEKGKPYTDRLRTQNGSIDRYNVWKSVVSSAVFLRRHVTTSVGKFDVSLGVGSGTDFGSGEETDYILRALQQGFHIEYCPELFVHHPNAELDIDSNAIEKAYRYGCGLGRVLSKHRYPIWFKARAIVLPLFGLAYAAIRLQFKRARLYWRRFQGRLKGVKSKTFNML